MGVFWKLLKRNEFCSATQVNSPPRERAFYQLFFTPFYLHNLKIGSLLIFSELYPHTSTSEFDWIVWQIYSFFHLTKYCRNCLTSETKRCSFFYGIFFFKEPYRALRFITYAKFQILIHSFFFFFFEKICYTLKFE